MIRLPIPRQTPLSLLICAVLAISPLMYFSLTPGAAFHDNQRILQVALLLVATVVFAVRQLTRREKVQGPGRGVAIALALFFGLGLISSLMAYSPRHALFEWSSSWLLLVLAALVATEIDAPGEGADRRIGQILLACGYACVIYIFESLVFYVIALAGHHQPDPQALTPGFDNYRFFNHVQTVSLPLLGLLALRMRDKAHRAMWWRMTALWWMLLFQSGGRGTAVGVLAGVVVAWLCLRETAWAWCRLMVLTALAGLAAYLVVYVALPWCMELKSYGVLKEVAHRSVSDPVSGRLGLWKIALQMIADHPVLGAGPMHFAHLARDARTNAHPHDWVLQIGSEWGLPALLCLATALAFAFRNLWRARLRIAADDARNRLMLAGLFGTGVAIVIDGLVSGLIVMPTSQLWLALYLGCTWGWLRSLDRPAIRRTTRLYNALAVLVTIGAAGLVLYGIFPEVLDIPAHEAPYRPPIRASFSPRLWRNGYF